MNDHAAATTSTYHWRGHTDIHSIALDAARADACDARNPTGHFPVASWSADVQRLIQEDYGERFGAAIATPSFNMDGSGPVCSWCGEWWPLCGHHRASLDRDDDTDSGW